ncbi:MAG TPA: HAD family hydrolase [Verrucomicrobiae bacterium]|nr:HAD family hydrolase [Verrucomicrobiae bacterium]
MKTAKPASQNKIKSVKSPSSRASKNSFGAVIFDIDNVLIDTRSSYLDTIRWTVEIFLTHGRIPLFTPAPKKMRPALLSLADVHQFKLLGGFNDDWDCCYGLLVYILSLSVSPRTILDLKKALHLKQFSARVAHRPLRVDGIVKMLGRPSFVTIEKISRIFQEIYLGKELFPKLEKKHMAYWTKKGLIRNEKLIIKAPVLEKLKAKGIKLGIATGRPRFEALYSLKHFGILDYFDAMTTIDEVKKEEKVQRKSLRKPHPYSLLETASRLGAEGKTLYVGDLPDDIYAANQAKASRDMASAAFLAIADDCKETLDEIKKAAPDFIFKEPADILKIV